MTTFSIIIPVYNEESMLKRQVDRVIRLVRDVGITDEYEILLVENGSSDSTYQKARQLEKVYHQVRVLKLETPSYGLAFKEGILHAASPLVFQFDLDFWDIDFLQMAIALKGRYDIIIGSKNLTYSHDNRPWKRRLMSKLIEIAIQWRFQVHLTDTHGLKALKRDKVLPLLDKIVCDNHFFDSELLIRSYYQGFRFKELPVDLQEIRESRFPFLIRLGEVIPECLRLLTVNLKKKRVARVQLGLAAQV